MPGPLFGECEGWEACLTFENAGKLIEYLNNAQTWMTDSWLACGNKEISP